ncbi:MAG: virulence RhuM family protein [Phycisphaeraceae bacterium]|nr:virulence RhuM family protein [Phycisphaeraceae bacterium]
MSTEIASGGGPGGGEFLLYQTEDGLTRVEVRIRGETVWLSLNQMAALFDRDKSVISRHIANVFADRELERGATVAEYATVQTEGGRTVERLVEYFNLDVVISVGYRVRSVRGTQFRIWATQRLREYIVKGFAMDDDRLKAAGGGGYFEELLARIRDIRSSERVFWRKVLDIYATSVDYDAGAEASQVFFQTVQNKMHWAIHGQTAAEVIHRRADASKPNMGLTTWAGEKPRRTDIGTAKNYLDEDELKALNLIVSAYLDFAELQALNRRPMRMQDWIEKLDDFLRLSERQILTHAGRVSHDAALARASDEFEKYRGQQASLPQPVDEHFDEAVNKVKKLDRRRPAGPQRGEARGKKGKRGGTNG